MQTPVLSPFCWGSSQPLPSPPPFPGETWPSAALPLAPASYGLPGGGRGSYVSITSSHAHCAYIIATSPLHHYLGRLALEGRGQGIGEEPDVDWEEELHEGDDDEHREGDHSKDVSSRPAKLEEKREREEGEGSIATGLV